MALAPTPKAPDHSSVPPAARRAAEAANAAIEAAAAARRGEGGDPPAQPSEPPQRPQPTHPTRTEDPPTPPPAGAEPAPSADPPVTPGGNDDPENLRHQLESEKGRTRKLRDQVSELSGRLNELERLLATVNTAQSAAPPAELSFERQELLTPEEKAEWGEVLPIIEKRAQELIAPLQAELKAKLDALDKRVGNVAQTTAQDARSRLLQTLDEHPLVGLSTDFNWRDLNGNEEFVSWLQRVDRHSGRTLQSLLQEAFNSNDASRFAAFFEDFVKEVTPPAAPQNGSQPAPQPKPGKVSLDTLAAPGVGNRSAAPPSGPADKPPITTGDIAKFYADRTAGRFKGRDDEAKAYEQEIFAAQRENRVIPGKPSR